jgi:hypothetical protein
MSEEELAALADDFDEALGLVQKVEEQLAK